MKFAKFFSRSPSRKDLIPKSAGVKPLLENERGIALMLALTTITVVAILTAELIYETAVYQRVVYNSIDNLRAKYLARGALKLARLQVHAANKASKKIQELGKNSPVTQNDVDQIYQTPLILPPPTPPGLGIVGKNSLDKFTEELGINGQISVQVIGEGNKLNLNRLVWLKREEKPNNNGGGNDNNPNKGDGEDDANPNDASNPGDPPQETDTSEEDAEKLKAARATITETLTTLLAQKIEADEEFAVKYDDVRADEIVGNVLAWIDLFTRIDGEGAPKEGYYADLTPPYAIKNAPLFSTDELSMVKGFDDRFVEFISENFTAALTDGINVNKISDSLLKALFPDLDDEMLTKFNEHRTEVGFAKIEDFWKYMQEELEFTEDDKKAIEERGISFTTKETAFRVVITTSSGDARRVWLAIMGAEPPDLTPPQPKPQTPPKPINPDAPEPDDNNQDANSPTANNDSEPPPIVYLRTD